jgi:hypothetical protein
VFVCELLEHVECSRRDQPAFILGQRHEFVNAFWLRAHERQHAIGPGDRPAVATGKQPPQRIVAGIGRFMS